MATSRAPWQLRAEAPEVAPKPDSALLIRVEASQPPEVICRRGSTDLRLEPLPASVSAATPWSAAFLCPPGAALLGVSLSGFNGGGGCSAPEPPPGAFVRVVSALEATAWQRSASLEQPVTLAVNQASTTFDVVVASRQPLEFVAKMTGATDRFAAPYVIRGPVASDAGDRHFAVVVSRVEGYALPVEGALSIRATTWGACPAEKPCEPGEDDGVRVVSITFRTAASPIR